MMYETALWAAMWWADHLRSRQAGKGIGDPEVEKQFNLINLFIRATVPPPRKFEIDQFEELLAAKINAELDAGRALDLYRDYTTPTLVADALQQAGLRSHDGYFPCKTGMQVNKSNVRVKDGYGKQYETMFWAGGR